MQGTGGSLPAAGLQTLLVQQAAMFLAWKCQICFKLAGKEADFKQRLLLCLPAQQTLVCGSVGWSQIRSMPTVVQERVLGHRDTSGDRGQKRAGPLNLLQCPWLGSVGLLLLPVVTTGRSCPSEEPAAGDVPMSPPSPNHSTRGWFWHRASHWCSRLAANVTRRFCPFINKQQQAILNPAEPCHGGYQGTDSSSFSQNSQRSMG